VYSLRDGLLRDLGFSASSADDVGDRHARALRNGPTLATG
jgi:hypothetical protein